MQNVWFNVGSTKVHAAVFKDNVKINEQFLAIGLDPIPVVYAFAGPRESARTALDPCGSLANVMGSALIREALHNGGMINATIGGNNGFAN